LERRRLAERRALSELQIKKLEAYPIKIPLVRPFRIAIETQTDYEGVLVRIELSDGTNGWGEASPDPGITGDTWRTAIAAIENEIRPRAVGKDVFLFEELWQEIDRAIAGNSSAKAALDIAVHDAIAKRVGLQLNGFLGREVNQLQTTQAVGIESLEETVNQTKALRDNGVTRFKFKIGGDPREDVKRIEAVRDLLGDAVPMTVDANQGYSVRQAIYALKRLDRFEIEFCEQPVHYRDLEGMAEVRRNSNIPIMADECVHSPRDALEVVKRRAADMINIKLMKSGGIRAGTRIAAIAEAADMPCMVGCMIETKVGISAGCHFATSQPIVKYADLDGYTSLKVDPVKGGVDLKGSTETLAEGPGLALTVDEAVLRTILA
jgi:L-alanine-DL-glutamate epimerase-like enolase superfamily enzyme